MPVRARVLVPGVPVRLVVASAGPHVPPAHVDALACALTVAEDRQVLRVHHILGQLDDLAHGVQLCSRGLEGVDVQIREPRRAAVSNLVHVNRLMRADKQRDVHAHRLQKMRLPVR